MVAERPQVFVWMKAKSPVPAARYKYVFTIGICDSDFLAKISIPLSIFACSHCLGVKHLFYGCIDSNFFDP